MNVYAPDRIWATVNGMSTRLPGGERQFIGGWSQDPARPGVTEYVRADLPNPFSAENARLREALKRSAAGWANAIELDLIPARHVMSAEILLKEARQALGDAPEAPTR